MSKSGNDKQKGYGPLEIDDIALELIREAVTELRRTHLPMMQEKAA